MFCTKCGRELGLEARFCDACGTPVRAAEENLPPKNLVQEAPVMTGSRPAAPAAAGPVPVNGKTVSGAPERKGKIKAPVLVLVLVLAAAGIWFAWTKVSGHGVSHANGFDTPREALDYFVDAVAKMDYEKAMEAFPIERAAENYDFYARTNWIQAWIPALDMPVPGASDGNIRLNQQFFAASRESQINHFIFSFFAEEELREGMPLQGEDEIRELFRGYNAEEIQKLTVVQMEPASPEIQEGDEYQEYAKRSAGIYGGDTLEDYMVSYQINAQTYIGGVQFIKYGGNYYIWNLNSPLGNTNGFYYVTPTEEWED